MKKTISILLSCIMLMAFLVSCSNPESSASGSGPSSEKSAAEEKSSQEPVNAGEKEEKKTFKIGMSWSKMSDEKAYCAQYYFETISNELGEEYGYDFQWITVVANGDATKEASNIQDLINQNVDVIVSRCIDSATIGASISAAKTAGIPFITYDHESKSGDPTCHVGVDAYGQSYRTSMEFAKILEEEGIAGKGIAIELVGSLADENSINRSKGWADAEAETGAWETVIQVNTNWEQEKFKTGLADALAEYPEANCLFIASDYCLPTVILALEEAGRWAKTDEDNHIYFATQDVMRDAYHAFEDGYLDCGEFFDVYGQCKAVCESIIKILNGEAVEAKILVAGPMVTQDTVKQLEHPWYLDYDRAVAAGEIEGVLG